MRRILVTAAVATLLAAPVLAAEPAGPQDVTCADMNAAIKEADPGKNPSKARQLRAIEAQDDLAFGLYWIHGWLVGKEGAAAPTLTSDWMKGQLVRLVDLCKARSPDGRMTLVQVMQP